MKRGETKLFIGEYEHSVDAKGRVIMPAKLREDIGEKFIVTKGLDGCLFAYSKTEWLNFEEKLNFTKIDTGATYRCVALQALRNGLNLKDEKEIIEIANNIDIKIDNTGEKDIILLIKETQKKSDSF